MIDDGIYSGTQARAFANATGVENKKIHLFTPFITSRAMGRLQDATYNVYPGNTMPSVAEFGEDDEFAKIGIDKRLVNALQFFEHKVPDEMSAPGTLFRSGAVFCKNHLVTYKDAGYEGPENEKALQFNCVPHISPPYKPKYEESLRLCDPPTKKFEALCNARLQIMQALLTPLAL